MKVLELFCGTKSISNDFKERGHEVYTVDWEKGFTPTLCADIGELTAQQIIDLCGGIPDVIWASPDCTTYSVAAISYHRRREPNGNLKAITEYAAKCDRINAHLIDLIRELNPKYWFIENPRGGMRKMDFMQGLPRYTVTYCQYGEKRQSRRIFGRTTRNRTLNRLARGAKVATKPRRVGRERERKARPTRLKRQKYLNCYVRISLIYARGCELVYKNKGKFVLDKAHLQQAVDEVLKRNGDVSINIKESPRKNSKSLYIYIYLGDCSTCLRVSDHNCRGQVRQIIVCKDTGAANVCYKIDRAIRELRYKKLQSVIKGLGNGF